MTVAATHYPHALILPGTPNVEIVQLDSAEPNDNLNELIAHASGDPLPSFVGFMDAAPGFGFTSTQIANLLDEVATLGVAVDYAGSNVDVEYREGNNAGLRQAIATTTHLRGRCGNAMLAFESLSAQQGQPATFRGRMYFRSSDGVTKPITWTDGVAITATQKVDSVYTLGPLKLNGSFVGGGQGAEWNNRLQVEEVRGDGEPFPTYTEIDNFRTMLTYRARNTALLATYNDPTAVTSLTLFLRKKLLNGYVVPDGTAEHIALTAAAGVVKAVSAAEKGVTELQILLNQDSGALFAIDTTAAIA